MAISMQVGPKKIAGRGGKPVTNSCPIKGYKTDGLYGIVLAASTHIHSAEYC